jgi:hypothetical protein
MDQKTGMLQVVKMIGNFYQQWGRWLIVGVLLGLFAELLSIYLFMREGAALCFVLFMALILGMFVSRSKQAVSLLSPKHLLMLRDKVLASFPNGKMAISADPLNGQHQLVSNQGFSFFKEFYLHRFPDSVLCDFFANLPMDVPVIIQHSPESAQGADFFLAAFAFENLDSTDTLNAFLSRQMLIFLTKKDPIFFLPKDAPEKVVEWKNWLVEEFGDKFEFFVFQEEHRQIAPSFYAIILPGVLLMALMLFIPDKLWRTLGSMLLIAWIFRILFQVRVMLKFKRIIKSMQAWRSGMSSS